MSKFSSQRVTFGIKKEGTAYTGETLAAGDFNTRVVVTGYGPTVEMFPMKYALGDYSVSPSFVGKRMGSITGFFPLAVGAANATAPNESVFFEMAGMKETTHTTVGVSWVTHADYSNVPATCEVVEKDEGTSPAQLVFRLIGAMADLAFNIDAVGDVVRVNFTITGIMDSIADRAFGSILNPTGQNTTTAKGILSSTITENSEVQDAGSFVLALNNNIVMHEDPSTASGYQGAHIADRGENGPTLTFTPFMELLANKAIYTRWIAGTEGAFSGTVGSGSPPDFTFSAPKIQVMEAYGRSDRNGFVSHNVVYKCNRSSGNDEFELLQKSKT